MSIKWMPNAVTILRFVLSIVVLFYALQAEWTTAAIYSAIALATDPFDGWLAVKLDARSKFGIIADPIADFMLTAMQIAGAVFTEVINWTTVGVLCFFFLATWLPVVLTTGGSKLNKLALGINRTYYVGVALWFIGLYFYIAFGTGALWLVAPALPLVWWGARISISHH